MRGRVGDLLELQEVARFDNAPARRDGHLRWDLDAILSEVVGGLELAGPADSVAVDGWAVDFGLLRGNGEMVAAPRCYRDEATRGILPRLFERIPAADLYRATGIQMMEINTLCQLMAMEGDAELAEAQSLLMLPDLVRHRLGGEIVAERTNASSTQMLGLDGTWSQPVINACGIRGELLPPVVEPAAVVGEARLAGSPPAVLVAGASHDTAAAVAGTPMRSPGDTIFISSGTWSLVGLEVDHPVTSPEAMGFNLSNEHGVLGTTRLLRNVMGLWLLQECRRCWAEEDGVAASFADLVALAEVEPAGGPVFDPDDQSLLAPAHMPTAIAALLARNDQPAPASRGAMVRAILESLALRYRWCVEALAAVTGVRPRSIHVVGGGSSNALLCRLTAAATGMPTRAGPVEATAAGNVAMQAIATGRLSGLAEARALVGASFDVSEYEPSTDPALADAYGRFRQAARV